MQFKILLSVFCILQSTFRLCNGGFLSHGPFITAPYGIGGNGNSNNGGSGPNNNNNNQQQQQQQPFNGAVLSSYSRYEHPAPTSSIYRQQIVNSVPAQYVGSYGANSQYYGNGNRPYGQGTNSNNGNYGY